MTQRPPATGREQVGDRQQQQHRVVVPQDRREELAGDDRDEVRGLGRRPARRHDDRDDDQDRARELDRRRQRPRSRPELVGDRAGREVVRRRDRVADAAGPASGSRSRRRARPGAVAATASTTRAIATRRRPPGSARSRSAQTRMSPGWSLIAAPERAAQARGGCGSSSQRQPTAKQQEQQRPDLAELHRVDERPRQARRAGRSTSGRVARDRQDRHADQERPDQQRDPEPDRGRSPSSEPERQDERRERRRVVEEPEAAARLELRSYTRLAVRAGGRPPGGRRGSRTRACRRRRARVAPTAAAEDEDRDDRQGRPGQAAASSSAAVTWSRRAPRPSARWISGIRKRSQATRRARPGRARIREPRRSYQRIGTIASR